MPAKRRVETGVSTHQDLSLLYSGWLRTRCDDAKFDICEGFSVHVAHFEVSINLHEQSRLFWLRSPQILSKIADSTVWLPVTPVRPTAAAGRSEAHGFLL